MDVRWNKVATFRNGEVITELDWVEGEYVVWQFLMTGGQMRESHTPDMLAGLCLARQWILDHTFDAQ
jgi:hypothetical protein